MQLGAEAEHEGEGGAAAAAAHGEQVRGERRREAEAPRGVAQQAARIRLAAHEQRTQQECFWLHFCLIEEEAVDRGADVLAADVEGQAPGAVKSGN